MLRSVLRAIITFFQAGGASGGGVCKGKDARKAILCLVCFASGAACFMASSEYFNQHTSPGPYYGLAIAGAALLIFGFVLIVKFYKVKTDENGRIIDRQTDHNDPNDLRGLH